MRIKQETMTKMEGARKIRTYLSIEEEQRHDSEKHSRSESRNSN